MTQNARQGPKGLLEWQLIPSIGSADVPTRVHHKPQCLAGEHCGLNSLTQCCLFNKQIVDVELVRLNSIYSKFNFSITSSDFNLFSSALRSWFHVPSWLCSLCSVRAGVLHKVIKSSAASAASARFAECLLSTYTHCILLHTQWLNLSVLSKCTL